MPLAASWRTMGLDFGMEVKQRESGLFDDEEEEQEEEEEDDVDDDDDAMEVDTDLETGRQRDQQRPFSNVVNPPTVVMGNEGTHMSAFISDLLKSTLGTTTTTEEDFAETERRIRKAEDELDEIRKKMGWYRYF